MNIPRKSPRLATLRLDLADPAPARATRPFGVELGCPGAGMRAWAWKDVGLRPLVGPALAVGRGRGIGRLAPLRLRHPSRPDRDLGPGARCRCSARRRARAVRDARAHRGAAAPAAALAARASASKPLPTRAAGVLLEAPHQVEVDARGARASDVGRADGSPVRAAHVCGGVTRRAGRGKARCCASSAELREDVGAESWGSSTGPPPGARAPHVRAGAARQRGPTRPGAGLAALARPASRGDSVRLAQQAQVGWTRRRGAARRWGRPSPELGTEREERFARAGVAHVLSAKRAARRRAGARRGAAPGTARSAASPDCGRRLDPRRPAAPRCASAVWGYVLFTGQQAPAVRSGVMLSCAAAGAAAAAPHRRAAGPGARRRRPRSWRTRPPFTELSLQLSFTARRRAHRPRSPRLRAGGAHPAPDPLRSSGWRLLLHRGREAVLATAIASAAVTPGLAAAGGRRLSPGLAGRSGGERHRPSRSARRSPCCCRDGRWRLLPRQRAGRGPLWLAGAAARASSSGWCASPDLPRRGAPLPGFGLPAGLGPRRGPGRPGARTPAPRRARAAGVPLGAAPGRCSRPRVVRRPPCSRWGTGCGAGLLARPSPPGRRVEASPVGSTRAARIVLPYLASVASTG